MAIVKSDSFEDALLGEETESEIAFDHAMDIAGMTYDFMLKRGMTRTDLARAMGKRPNQVTRILQAQGNMTLMSMASIEKALKIRFRIVPTSGDQREASSSFVPVSTRREGTWKPSDVSYVAGASR